MMTSPYGLSMSKELEGKLARCRAPIRSAIRAELKVIAVAASGDKASRIRALVPKEPPHRFYVYEGYRVFYQVDPRTRRVVVLSLGPVAS